MPLVVKELRDAGLSIQDAMEVWQQGFKVVDEAVRPAESGDDMDAAFLRYVREKIHLLKRRQAAGKVDNSTGFLLEAMKTNYANPEFDQEQKRQNAAEARKGQQRRHAQKKQLEEQLEALKKARDEALGEAYDAIAASAPEVLDAALPDLLKTNVVLLNMYKRGRSALENYRASFALQGALTPCLESHDPERIHAVRAKYAADIMDLEQQIAALQAV
jgi:hypothetical protein